MRLPDGTILMHGRTPYDPVKAHEYYMRTRKLKGRKKAAAVVPTQWTTPWANRFAVKTSSGKVNLKTKSVSEQQAYADKRVKEIIRKARKLRSEFKKAMAKAEADMAAFEAKKFPRGTRKSNAPSKSNRKAESSGSSATTEQKDPVAELEAKISQIKGALEAALAKQRELMAATKNG